MSRLYLVSTWNPGTGYEVLRYDKAEHLAVLKDQDGKEYVDTNFHIDIVKRSGLILTSEKPDFFRGE